MITDAPKTALFGTPRRHADHRTDPTLRARVRTLRTDVAEALQLSLETLAPDDPHLEFAPETVADFARLCLDRSTLLGESDESSARPLFSLAMDLQQLALELHLDELSLRTQRLSNCAEGLNRLRTLPSSHHLLEAVCEELVNRCDFGRAVLSRVESGTWIPAAAYFSDANSSWFSEYVEQGIPLHGHSPEARMLTERLPAVVYDTANAPVHRQIIVESGQSTSYVVAPLMAGSSVVGFLHADHSPSTRQADEEDRDVLWSFAAGFTRIHERMVLMERVQAQRTEVEQVLGSALRGIGEQPGLGIMGTGQTLVAAQSETLAELTARETEVLHLMLEGATNQVIASRLFIARDTVKSHVKQILRKLGVTNRAQAIARASGTAID